MLSMLMDLYYIHCIHIQYIRFSEITFLDFLATICYIKFRFPIRIFVQLQFSQLYLMNEK